MRACVRDTVGSAMHSVEAGERPIKQVLDQRHAVAAGEHELERRLRAVQRRAAAPAERSAAHHLAAAVRAQHARAPYSTVSGWNAGLSPSSRSDR